MPRPITSTATTAWRGDLTTGSGTTTLATSGLGTFDVSWKARTAPGAGATTPEELIAAAHASCYSMALSASLAAAGTPPKSLDVTAAVTLVVGTGITGIHLTVRGDVPGVDADGFRRYAQDAKAGCPVSQALQAVPITLDAQLA